VPYITFQQKYKPVLNVVQGKIIVSLELVILGLQKKVTFHVCIHVKLLLLLFFNFPWKPLKLRGLYIFFF